jgi:hypothetical protein
MKNNNNVFAYIRYPKGIAVLRSVDKNRSSLASSPRESLDFSISKNGKVIAKKNVNFTTGKVTDII